jgi:RNA polymerase sigma-70 factor (ECF subfamily)
MNSLTDEQIMLEVKNGNKKLFDIILERHYKNILNYSYRLTGDKGLAEDATQEIFSKVFFSAKRYKPTAPFKMFLYTIAYRENIKLIKKNKIFSFKNDENIDIQSNDNPSTNLEKKHMATLMKNAILKLTPKYRAAIILREYNDLSYEEISRILNCTLQDTKNYLFRAKTKLKEILSPVLRGAL